MTRAVAIGLKIPDNAAFTAAVALRTVLRIIDFLPAFYLLGLLVIGCSGRRRQRLGDLASHTTVRRA